MTDKPAIPGRLWWWALVALLKSDQALDRPASAKETSLGSAMSWGKHKKILAMAKGYRGRANSCYRTAINRVEKGLQYQYRDRKQKKRVRNLFVPGAC